MCERQDILLFQENFHALGNLCYTLKNNTNGATQVWKSNSPFRKN